MSDTPRTDALRTVMRLTSKVVTVWAEVERALALAADLEREQEALRHDLMKAMSNHSADLTGEAITPRPEARAPIHTRVRRNEDGTADLVPMQEARPHNVSFEKWLSYQPWIGGQVEGQKWYTEASMRAAWDVGAASEALPRFIDAVEKIAFEMKPPNAYTPRLVQLCVEMRLAMNSDPQRKP